VPGTFTSDNPAAIKWGAPSRIGFGALVAKSVNQPSNTNYEYSGGGAGFRAVGETLAFGLSAAHIADMEAGFEDVKDIASANVALQTGSSIAWGLGYNSGKTSQDSFESETKESVFGISVRLGELWFAGATIGREAKNQKDTSVPTRFSAERDTIQYGLGFRRGGSVLVHIEAFGGHKNELKDGSVSLGSEDAAGGTMEFTFGPILIGGSAQHVTFHDVSTQFGIESADITTGDLGWAPRQGFSLVLHYESHYVKFDQAAVPIDYRKEELGAVQATWQF
jgi:hypothetical protein